MMFVLGVLGNTPDKAEGYKDLGGGRWSVGDRVYPVARPVRGQIITMASKDKGEGE